MKQQRLRYKLLALFVFCLFALLAVYGCYSILTYGNRWFASSRNPRVRAQKEQVAAGDILDRDGLLLATTDASGTRHYAEDEAVRRAMVHLLGDSEGQVSNGVEAFQTNYLYGFDDSLLDLAGGLVSGSPRTGNTVRLTVSAPLCAELAAAFDAHAGSAGKRGAAVVLNWKTGAVEALTSRPSFDPEAITAAIKGDPGQPFWNRATQAVIPPGSTFKVVAAAAALEQLSGIEEVSFTCTTDVLDFGDHVIADYGGGSHGTVRLREAFIQSCNKMFANVAVNVGWRGMLRTAERFGFNDNFLFRDLVVENSSYPTSAPSSYELAACGFGQSGIAATPLHLCMIAAGVANGGVMMEPRLLQEVTSASGRRKLSFSSSPYRTCMPASVAGKLQEYMRAVVTQGTGRQAAVSGLKVCGKTGTADSTLDGNPVTYGWFIGYLDEEDLPYAICVLVEDLDSGVSGGSAAAPIAADAFRWLRDHRTPEGGTAAP
ncbi:MAG: hypothetical protein IKH38_04300 [Clostridia bacterium]|nr:hypothetical protein [Clostridia bacterium]